LCGPGCQTITETATKQLQCVIASFAALLPCLVDLTRQAASARNTCLNSQDMSRSHSDCNRTHTILPLYVNGRSRRTVPLDQSLSFSNYPGLFPLYQVDARRPIIIDGQMLFVVTVRSTGAALLPCLVDLTRQAASARNTCLNSQDNLPTLYVLNAAALTKPHAVEHLAADLIGYKADVAAISETHLKKKHIDQRLLSVSP